MASLGWAGWVSGRRSTSVSLTGIDQQPGYPMARNLRNKIAQSDTMIIHDVNPAVTNEFAKEMGNVEIAKSVREIAENTVGTPSTVAAPPAQDEHPFSIPMT